MKYFIFLFFTILFLSFSQPSAEQPLPTYCYNLNSENGLPSNHIYRIITDRFGYLWLTTPKGAIRYNGYDFKVFNLADGLSTDDVWNLTEDKKGRIWLGCISHELGYLYNNKYHKAYLHNINHTLYPADIVPAQNGDIVFVSANAGRMYDLYREHNDSVLHYGYKITDTNTQLCQQSERFAISFPSGYQTVTCGNNLFEVKFPLNFKDTLATVRHVGKVPQKVLVQWGGQLIDDYMIFPERKKGFIGAWNARTNTLYEIDLSLYSVKEKIDHIYPAPNYKYFYAVCDKTLVKFDRHLNFKGKYLISDLIHMDGMDGSKAGIIHHSIFWKNCIGTTTSGVYVNNEVINHFKRHPFDLENYVYLGRFGDTISLWWNASIKRMAFVTGTTSINYADFPDVPRFEKALTLRNGQCLLGGHGISLLKNRKQVVPLANYVDGVIYDFVATGKNQLLAATNRGLVESLPNGINKLLNPDRYKHVLYDPVAGDCWAYNNERIFIFRPGSRDKLISGDELKRLGMRRIEKIDVDKVYGNIFLKGHNSIVLYNRETNTFQLLFEDYNLESAVVEVYDNMLVAAGRFGVLFSKIEGKNKLTKPVLYSNLRDINYRFAYEIVKTGNDLLIQTNKGVYSVPMPGDDELISALAIPNDNFQWVLNYRDSLRSIHTADTVFLNQSDLKLQFDIINPNGSGQLKYQYKMPDNTSWLPLNSSELILPSLMQPDRYYNLYLVAQDNAWKSPPIKLKLYIRPFWWQTTLGRRSLYASATLLILIVIASSILITRRLVLRTAQKRNLQMELELKAIYAQINPHFIFNTLNSALLLVSKNKMEDAYMHISKFSRLLRSYIKSSRNKLISIADEIDNLEDYMELQQTRFKNKFSYDIIIDGAIEPSKVRIPALLLQPFVENAINHGILPKADAGHLKIEFRKDAAVDEIVCIVEDDGVGRTRSNDIEAKHEGSRIKESYGDLLIKDLVNIFNRYEHMNIAIKYVDKTEPLTGTIVYIQIKNPYHDK